MSDLYQITAPGTDDGPCREACTHPECRVTRQVAESACAFCGEPIGYGAVIVPAGSGKWYHAPCEEELALRLRWHQR